MPTFFTPKGESSLKVRGVIDSEIALETPVPAGLSRVAITAERLSLLHDFCDGDVYRTGQNSWSPAGWVNLSGDPLRIANPERRRTADDDPWDDPIRHHSSWVIALSDGMNALLVGCLKGDTPRLHADTDVLSAWTETGTPATWVIIEGPELAVFTHYRDLLGKTYGTRTTDPGTVWSSWYAYYETISRAEIDRVLPAVKELGFTTFQIDDGWEKVVGHWEANRKFSSGMADAASAIKEQGLRPGLWLAPFITLPSAENFEKNKQMLLRDSKGDLVVAGANWGERYFTYDFTRPDAQEMLAELIDKVVRLWGYDYLKLDFINAGAVPGARSVDIDREAAFRQACTLMREVAGEETYILGSGALLMPSLGIFDAVRTGPDVAPMWSNYASDDPSDAMASNALRNVVERLWMKGLIGLDPDAVYVRRRRNLLSEPQIQALQDAAVLSGFRSLSDPPAWLDEDEKSEVRAYLAKVPESSRVSRYEYVIGDRVVDFEEFIHNSHQAYPL